MDKARKDTDKRLAEMEAELTKIYQKSAKGIYAKWDKYMDEAAQKIKPLQEIYDKAKQNGNADEIKSAGIALSKAKKEVTLQSTQYQKMLDETSRRLSLVNKTAVAYLNKQIPDIYALNYNSISGDAFKVGIKMGLVDAHTINRLIENGKIPQKKISEEKDIRWNKKQINSAVLQGILQGDSIPKISNRIFNQIASGKDVPDIISKNKNSAVRMARTMVTGAECGGRIDSYRDLESRGVVLKKVWIATPDDRTRESHLELDGEEVDANEEFSNGCMYPGDPNGDPSEVYNCRCSIRTHIIGFRKDDGSISKVDYEREETLHDKQMEGERGRRGIEKEKPAEKSMPKISFTPASTIEEAERFANETFIDGGFNLTGKNISYSGIDITVANRINERLNEIYSQYNIQKLSSLEAYGKKNKKVYAKSADAPFFTTNFGNIGMNTTFVKSESQIAKYVADGGKAFQYVMDNISTLSGAQLELAKAYQTAGRNLVDNSLEGMITHEIGHHISYMTDVNKHLAGIQSSDWKKYAKSLSGYASHSFGEYVAESFTSYYNGDTSKLQPELMKVFEGLKK